MENSSSKTTKSKMDKDLRNVGPVTRTRSKTEKKKVPKEIEEYESFESGEIKNLRKLLGSSDSELAASESSSGESSSDESFSYNKKEKNDDSLIIDSDLLKGLDKREEDTTISSFFKKIDDDLEKKNNKLTIKEQKKNISDSITSLEKIKKDVNEQIDAQLKKYKRKRDCISFEDRIKSNEEMIRKKERLYFEKVKEEDEFINECGVCWRKWTPFSLPLIDLPCCSFTICTPCANEMEHKNPHKNESNDIYAYHFLCPQCRSINWTKPNANIDGPQLFKDQNSYRRRISDQHIEFSFYQAIDK